MKTIAAASVSPPGGVESVAPAGAQAVSSTRVIKKTSVAKNFALIPQFARNINQQDE